MKRLVYILLIFFCFKSSAQQTFSISATVTGEKGEIIPGATAFLTNTKYAMPTNSNGQIAFKHLPSGTYELVIKMIGYMPFIKNITLAEKSANLLVRLKENNKELNAVTIKATDPNREKYLVMFVKNFIGESTNAGICKITNPDVLEFHYDKQTDVLTAGSEKMLTIENAGLGYRLKYLITDFEFDTRALTFFYKGYPYFEELKGTESQQKKWQQNRKIAYYGSVSHFFRAVFNGTAEAEGFYIFKTPDTTMVRGRKVITHWQLSIDSVFKAYNKSFKLLNEKYNKRGSQDTTELYVAFRGGKEPYDFLASSWYVQPPIKLRSSNDELSKLQPLEDTIAITQNGVLRPSRSFLISGYWAWQKVAELTPLDYHPDINPADNSAKPKQKTDDEASPFINPVKPGNIIFQ